MRAAAMTLVLLAGCTSDNVLVVQVRTDLAPGADFDRVEATVDGLTLTTRADEARDWGLGVRVVELTRTEGRRRVHVGAYLGSALVVERWVQVDVHGITSSTVFLTRACQGVTCPGPGDPAGATACVAGACASEGCSEEHPEACAPPPCESCPAATGCAVGECTASAGCFVTLDHAACADGGVCAADGTCRGPSRCAPYAPSGLRVEAGWDSTALIAEDRPSLFFGRNHYRVPLELGDAISTPAELQPDTSFLTLHLGDEFACGTLDDGRFVCWGETRFGMLGDGREEPGGSTDLVFPHTGPLVLADGTSRFWLGGYGFCVDTGTETRCAGRNELGQLGIGTDVDAPEPAAQSGRYTSLDMSHVHGCGVREDGSLWCWGENLSGGLGIAPPDTHLTPTRVGTDTDWSRVEAGLSHTVAVRADGTVWTWGQREHVGRERVIDAWIPAPLAFDGALPARDITAGHNHGCAIYADGTLVCWGADWCEQLGNPETTTDAQLPFEPMPGGRFVDVAAGQCHTCALSEDGALYCWGTNLYGQLGDPTLAIDATVPTPHAVCFGP